jgi:hypothetical protein
MSAASLVVVASLAATATGLAQPPVNAQAKAMVEFKGRVAAYVDLAKTLSDKLPALKQTDDPAEISAREIALGNAIREGRAAARPGDILTRETAQIFRKIVKADFRRRSQQRQKLVLAEIPHFHPRVNQTYPSEAALATFPSTLLNALPALPEGIEYRLLSEALILHDVKANIIVDFILDVF